MESQLEVKVNNLLQIVERQQSLIDQLYVKITNLEYFTNQLHQSVNSSNSYIAGQIDRNSGR